MKISVIIITLNEERNIGRCLESVKDVADEIIVADSFSEDKTEEICAKYNVTFVKQKWLGFAEQKNFANDLAHNDWILSIDADEALSEELKKSVLELKKRDFDEHNVFSLNRLTNYCGKWIHHSGWYPDTKVRIFNRKFVKWGGDAVHETLVFDGNKRVTRLRGDLEHFSYYTIEEHKKRSEKYAEIFATSAFMRGKHASKSRMIVKTLWRFFHDYVLRLGFLDGKYGFIICKTQAGMTYKKYKKLIDLQNNTQCFPK